VKCQCSTLLSVNWSENYSVHEISCSFFYYEFEFAFNLYMLARNIFAMSISHICPPKLLPWPVNFLFTIPWPNSIAKKYSARVKYGIIKLLLSTTDSVMLQKICQLHLSKFYYVLRNPRSIFFFSTVVWVCDCMWSFQNKVWPFHILLPQKTIN
jgi:hypothetical protein